MQMNQWRDVWLIAIATLMLISLLFIFKGHVPPVNKEKEPPVEEENGQQEKDHERKDKVIWGIDSASSANEQQYRCVAENFGEPKVWGRYLGDLEGASVGLSVKEAEYLHANDIKILLIYNHVTDARGHKSGFSHAEKAASLADELGVPKEKAIFVDIEPDYPVDSDFIKGWMEGMENSGYHAGIYGVFSEEQDLYHVFKEMVESDEKLESKMIVWTAHPQTGISTQANAPEYKPEAPDGANVLGWQYGIDAKSCNIDTNLFKGEIIDYLW